MKTLMAILVFASAGSAALADDFFDREIRPLLIEKCQSCHGDEKVRGGLKLTAREAVLKGGASGPALAPGKGALKTQSQRLGGGSSKKTSLGVLKPRQARGRVLSSFSTCLTW